MKATGIVRRVDDLGRIVLPIEVRRRLNLDSKDGVEIYMEKDRVILKKYEPSCIFCESSDDVVYFKDKRICKKCLEAIKAGKSE